MNRRAVLILAIVIPLLIVPVLGVTISTLNSSRKLNLDGVGFGGCTNQTSSCQATFSTSTPNDIIIVFATEVLDVQLSCNFSITDSANLTWTARTAIVFGNNGRDEIQEFWASSTSALSSDIVTESLLGCGNEYNNVQVFGISGANFNTPFDSSSAVPGSASGFSGGTSVTISTTHRNDFVFAYVSHGGAEVPVPQPGFTVITCGGARCGAFEITRSQLTNFAVTFGDSTVANWEEIADAVQSNH